MGLTSWKGAPNGKIHKYDVVIAKNYLSEEEIGQLERLVSAYLDLAEMQAIRYIPMTMADWEERLNGFLQLWDQQLLKDNGKISAEMAKKQEYEFEKIRVRTLKAINNLNLLLTIHLGHIGKLVEDMNKKLLTIKIILRSKSLKNNVLVWISQIARGIGKILSYARNGIKEWQKIKGKEKYKQLELRL